LNSIPVRHNESQEGTGPEFQSTYDLLPIASSVDRDESEIAARLETLRQQSIAAANCTAGFVQIPNRVVADPELTSADLRVYSYMLSRARSKDHCWPGQKRIAQDTGLSLRTVIRSCQRLHERGYIEKLRRGQGYTNIYFVNHLDFVFSQVDIPAPTAICLQPPAPRSAKDPIIPRPGSPLADLYGVTFYAADPADDPGDELNDDATSTDGTSRSDILADQEVSEWHTKNTKANVYQGQHTYISRSAPGAPLGEKVGAATIGNQNATEETKKRNETVVTEHDPLLPKSNTSPSSEKLPDAAGAEAVEKPKSRRKRHKKGEIPPPLPLHVQNTLLAPLSVRFCDKYPKSSRTSMAWYFDDAVTKRGMSEHEFYATSDEARDITIARTKTIQSRNDDDSIAQMRYYLSVLENLIDTWCTKYDAEIEAANAASENQESQSDPEAEETAVATVAVTSRKVEQPEESSQDAAIAPDQANDQGQQAENETTPAPSEPDVIRYDDPDTGWKSYDSAAWWAEKVLDRLGRAQYTDRVLPTLCPGRYGFVIRERSSGNHWEFVDQEAVRTLLRSQR
jgi:hypothetical protein